MMGRPKKYKTKGERKIANKKYKKEWYKKNKLYVKKYRRKWYLKNKEKVAKKHQTSKYRLIQKKLRIKNKVKYNAYARKHSATPKAITLRKKSRKRYAPILRKKVALRKKTDVNYKLRLALSKRVLAAVKFAKTKKAYKTQKLIGCSITKMRKHIEKQFEEVVQVNNFGARLCLSI